MLGFDIWQSIFEQSHNIPFQIVLSFRLICKNANCGCIQLMQLCKSPVISARRVLIQFNTCMCCSRSPVELHSFSYLRDSFPRRLLVCCCDWECWLTTFCKFITDATYEKIYPFLEWETAVLHHIPRANGGFSRGIIEKYSPLYNDGRVCVKFENVSYMRKQQFDQHKNSFLNLTMTKLIPLVQLESNQYLTKKTILFRSLFADYMDTVEMCVGLHSS